MKEALFIQKAKRGELVAWKELDPITRSRVVGLFEIPKPPDDWNPNKVPVGVEPIGFKVAETVASIANVFNNSSFILDISAWAPDATVNYGTHVIEHAIQSALIAGGAPEICANFGSCAVSEYKDVLSNFSTYVTVLRLDVAAIEDSKDTDYFTGELDDLLRYWDIQASQLTVLVDFGDVAKYDETAMFVDSQRVRRILDPYGFAGFSIAGSSMPAYINDVVDSHFSDGKVTRKEFSVWKQLAKRPGGSAWTPANYGIRSAEQLSDFPNKYSNGKSKRTIDGGFKVFRGISRVTEALLLQHPKLAVKIVADSCFPLLPACWGDNMVSRIANGNHPGGGHEQWISYDLNQHITFVLSEVREFRQSIVAAGQV